MNDRTGPAGSPHAPRHGLSSEKCRAQVEAEHGIELILRHVEEVSRAVGAGVVEQDVERIPLGQRGLQHRRVADIASQSLGLSTGITDRSGRRFDLAAGTRHQRDVRTGRSQCGGAGEADAALPRR